jgi:uncharacterized protein (TIGR02266 family)
MDDPNEYDYGSVQEIRVSGFFEAIDRLAAFKAEALLPSGKSDPILAQRIKELELYRDAFLAQVAKRRPDFSVIEQSKDAGAPIVLEIGYSSGLEFYEGLSLSLNRGGLFVKTEALLPIDSMLDLTVKVEDIHIEFKVTAKVIWINPRETSARPIGLGLKFPKMTNDQRALLEEYMQGSVPTATLADLTEK